MSEPDPDRRRREAVERATEAVGRRLLELGRLLAYLDHSAARSRREGADEHHDMTNAEASALRWAIPIVRAQAEVEVAAAVEREECRKRWGVHRLPDAVVMDPEHGRALTHARSLRVELGKMKLRTPGGAPTLADVYGRLLDAVVAAIEEHAYGFYWEQVTTPPRMVLRSDGVIVMDRRDRQEPESAS